MENKGFDVCYMENGVEKSKNFKVDSSRIAGDKFNEKYLDMGGWYMIIDLNKTNNQEVLSVNRSII